MHWCDICAAYVYGSHYHCPKCWGECSMMGHLDCARNPEPERTPAPLRGEPAKIHALYAPPEVIDRFRRNRGLS